MVYKRTLCKGIKGASGFAVAKALLIKDIDLEISDYEVKDDSKEIKKLGDSLSHVSTRLEKQVEFTRQNQGEENAKVVEAHISLLKDPTIKEEINKEINDNKVSASRATFTIMNKWEKKFEAIKDNEYFRERAKDVRDVFTQLIKDIEGIPLVDLSQINEEVIIVTNGLSPSQTSQLNPLYIKGIVTEEGSATSHTALMAENMKIPAILGIKDITKKITDSCKILIYAEIDESYIIINPSPNDLDFIQKQIKKKKIIEAEILKFANKKTETSDHKLLTLEANISGAKDAKKAFEQHAEGIGLMRTEFLYMENPNELPNEEVQYNAYKTVLEIANDYPVIIRTLDIGGDKELASFPLEKEMNPFLGFRAIRISLENKSLFRTQLRALYRASNYGNLKIMFPFISNVSELLEAKEFAMLVKEELVYEGKKINDNVEIGMMIEIPSTIWMASTYAKYVDFFSVGTNDLVQYMYAVDRMNPKIADKGSYFDPAFLKALNELIEKAKNIPIAMCGQMASDPIALPLLVGLGFSTLSMSSSKILYTRRTLSYINKGQAKKMVKKILKTVETPKDVLKILKERYKEIL